MEGSSQNHYRESGEGKTPNEPSMSEKIQSSDRRSNIERRAGDLRWWVHFSLFLPLFLSFLFFHSFLDSNDPFIRNTLKYKITVV
jgi:hypothetical protein